MSGAALDTWNCIDVDGEPWEWRAIHGTSRECDGRPPGVRPRRGVSRAVTVLVIRRPADDSRSFGVEHAGRVELDEADARDAIRTYRGHLPPLVDRLP